MNVVILASNVIFSMYAILFLIYEESMMKNYSQHENFVVTWGGVTSYSRRIHVDFRDVVDKLLIFQNTRVKDMNIPKTSLSTIIIDSAQSIEVRWPS